LILHKIKLSPPELMQLRRLAHSVVFDVDDAIYYRRPRRLGQEPDRSWWRRFKFARTCALADLVVAGNRTLARRAALSAGRVEVVPTPVDLARYEQHSGRAKSPHTLVWIGLPENIVYLELVRPVVARLASEFPRLSLRVVSSASPDWPDVPVEFVPCSSETEVSSLLSAGIGVMPLTDDDWTRGKCAFKLIQYMAAALPCVGSAVGANHDVVDDGVSGYLAHGFDGWEQALRMLLTDEALAERMGMAGRARVREEFDVQVIAPRVADLLEELAGGPS
jgi:glycosyltransferase involved in cell wall biosynthesis